MAPPTKPRAPRLKTAPKLNTSHVKQIVGSEKAIAIYLPGHNGNQTPHEDITSTDTQDADLVKKTLRAIMQDVSAPAAAKAQAARTLAEMVQALGRHAPAVAAENKPIRETSRGDLEAELARLLLG